MLALCYLFARGWGTVVPLYVTPNPNVGTLLPPNTPLTPSQELSHTT